MRRRVFAGVTAVVIIVATFTATGVDASTTWVARWSSGVATIRVGSPDRLSVSASRLRPATRYSVSLRRGGCASFGPLIVATTAMTTSTGTLARTLLLTTLQTRATRLPLAVRVGSGCGAIGLPTATITPTPTPTAPPSPTTSPITEFALPTAGNGPFDLATGPDGNLWFTDTIGNKIGRMTPSGTVIEFTLPVADSRPWGIAAGPDGNLWFGENGDSARGMGRITPGGVITQFNVGAMNHGPCPPGCPICTPPVNASKPAWVTLGPDGAMWFSDANVHAVGRMTTDGTYIEFSVPQQPLGVIFGLTAGPDGNIWFADYTDNQIGRLTPSGVLTRFPVPAPGYGPQQIAAGPDGALWFTQIACTTTTCAGSQIGRVDTSGNVVMFPLPNAWSMPNDIVAGPDGNLWFIETQVNRIGRITPTGTISEFATPTPNSSPSGIAVGPDGNIWFGERSAIGRLVIPHAP
jgi:streptogramin lyase